MRLLHPGLIVTTHDLLRRNPSPTDPEVREALAGNLCRCTGYEKVLAAVRLAAERVGEADRVGGAGRLGGAGRVGDAGRVGGATGGRSGPGAGVWTTPGAPSGRGLPSRSGAPESGDRDDARLGIPAKPGQDDTRSETGEAGA